MKNRINTLIFIVLLATGLAYNNTKILSQKSAQVHRIDSGKIIEKNKLLIDSIVNLQQKVDSTLDKTKCRLLILKEKQNLLEKQVNSTTFNKKNN